MFRWMLQSLPMLYVVNLSLWIVDSKTPFKFRFDILRNTFRLPFTNPQVKMQIKALYISHFLWRTVHLWLNWVTGVLSYFFIRAELSRHFVKVIFTLFTSFIVELKRTMKRKVLIMNRLYDDFFICDIFSKDK